MTSGDPIRFVIFAAPRTGSNLLCSLLNSHPEILCHHGLFNPRGIHYALDQRQCTPYLGTMEEREREPGAFIERVWRHDHGRRAVGFKLNLGEQPAAVAGVLCDSRVRKIVLRRRNRVRTYVSEQIAERSGEWENYAGNIHTATDPVEVNPEELFQHVERNRHYYCSLERELSSGGQTWLNVHYEMLASGDLFRILEFLGRGSSVATLPPLTAGSFQQNPRELRHLIVNFEKLKSRLAGTELECDLDADAAHPIFSVAAELTKSMEREP